MMIQKKRYEQDTIELQLSSFQGDGGVTEYHALFSVCASSLPYAEQLSKLLSAYTEWLEKEMPERVVPVFRRYFLSDAVNQTEELMEAERFNLPCALSIVQQPPLNGSKIALWVYMQSDGRVRCLNSYTREVIHGKYRHLWTGRMSNRAANSEFQTRLLLNDYSMQLTEQQCSLAADCIRTWFFVQNVDVNYSGVVKARKEVFITQGLTEDTHYITSTGIEGRHPDPDVLVQMDAYAVRGLKPEQIQYLYAPTHLNPTYEYGVTFERGVAVTYGDRKQVYLSGTASINNKGEIVHPGDILKQTERMMENVEVLLQEGGATASDIVQALIYLRDPADYLLVKSYFEAEYPSMPYLILLAPVCRPGWLIEMECIAEVNVSESAYAPF
ncbi:hypothetical protein LJC57_07795 [Parabacteroides sp. OttesenSCG-928-G07]|nr:hypothetical protein [Parabacteroides sp. OttesenSCG-928-G21]MDL2278479.1 hypothetical protein [Parabacteroides sp. OttesenSCG-928-G07]